ncbi:MAG: alpha/beta fold hydrolase [Chloroflexi bacterium]|nr:alpha/beta fold hydrolase [Chloroflexota bacterium]
MSREHTTIPGDISLEAAWHFPEADAPWPAVVVCHPHPLYGGNMSSNVVFAICQALAERAIAALRFNFRGVGQSQGEFGEGLAEQEDIRAALDFVLAREDIDRERIGLAGYSFGGGVSLPVAVKDERVKMLALVSPALAEGGWEELERYAKPKLVIAGENDFVIPREKFLKLAGDMPAQYQVIAGADHFWGGYEEEVAEKVSRFFGEGFGVI